MTLLEALVALVILGLASLGFLGAFQSASRATQDAALWVQAVGYAETAIEQTKLGAGAQAVPPEALPQGFAQAIDVQPWDGARDIDLVSVTVRLPDGGAFVLHRLARAR